MKCDILDTIYFFQQPAGSSRSIIGASNKTTSTKATTKRKISKPLTRKTPSHSKINTKNIVPKDFNSPVAAENPCQSEKSFQSEEKSCQRLSLPASTNVTSTSTTSSVLPTSSLDKKRVRFFDQARSGDTLASRAGSTPPNAIKIETQLPGALVSPFKEEGGGKTIVKRIIDELSYENVSSNSSDSSASSSSEDEEEYNTPLNTQNSEERSLGKNFTAQTVSISKTAHNNTDDDKKLMPPPPKLPTQLKKNGGHEKKDGGQSIDFKKTE